MFRQGMRTASIISVVKSAAAVLMVRTAVDPGVGASDAAVVDASEKGVGHGEERGGMAGAGGGLRERRGREKKGFI